MREHGKIQQREIAKKRLEAGYKVDKMEAMSSADFATKEDDIKSSSPSKSDSKFTDALNKLDIDATKYSDSGSGSTKKVPNKSSF